MFMLIVGFIFKLEEKKIVEETIVGKKIYADSLKLLIDSLLETNHIPFVGYTEPLPDASSTTIYIRGKEYKFLENQWFDLSKRDIIFNQHIMNLNNKQLQIYADNKLVKSIEAHSSSYYKPKFINNTKYVCGNVSIIIENITEGNSNRTFE